MPLGDEILMKQPKINRRAVLQAGASTAALLSLGRAAHAAGSDKIRVGVIGCGGRGRGAALNCVASSEGVEIVALGDLFPDHLADARNIFQGQQDEALAADAGADRWLQVTDETSFVGFDAFEKVLACDVDLVILATPPHFRPQHLTAAVKAGKHVFMEKPVAVDPVGVRKVIAAGMVAEEKGLGIVAGTQRRHQASYLEVIGRIHDGAIGEVLGGECYWNQGSLWAKARKEEWSDMEWQLRNWLYFTWASGDHICEQHIHNLDVMNWVIGATPVRATGMGGREVRIDPLYGNIFDHFAVELEYPDGQYVHSFCRQIDGCATRVNERVVGSKGISEPGSWIRGDENLHFRRDASTPYEYEQEHTDLIASIRAGAPLNEAKRVAESTLTAIMARMSTYTGKTVTWEQAMESKLDLSPPHYEFGDVPIREVAVPGQTKLI
jgi:myo-inositol 2-dehydrogenase / D-chiro-inositol 1-dehydrogenase